MATSAGSPAPAKERQPKRRSRANKTANAADVSPNSVHYTAGTILCQAADATVTDFHGDPLHTTPGLLAAATPEINADLVNLLAPHLHNSAGA